MLSYYCKKAFGMCSSVRFNPSNLGEGMEKLLDNGNNLLMLVESTDPTMAGFVIKAAKKRADELTAMASKTVLSSITARTEAQEEANGLNVINQPVTSAKEGVVKTITKLVDSNVTDAILRTSNGSYNKSINELSLYKVMKAAINGANQPSTNNVLEQLIKVINHNFNFCKKVNVNIAAQVAMHDIVIGIPQLTLTLLANIKRANKSD
jgi:hypothetical protein